MVAQRKDIIYTHREVSDQDVDHSRGHTGQRRGAEQGVPYSVVARNGMQVGVQG